MKDSPLHHWTPLLESTPMSDTCGKHVMLKMECYQPTGSFKIRGIGLLCQELSQQGVNHFISSSGGNAGYAVAYAAKQLNAEATVFVPTTTSEYFIKMIEGLDATVHVHGDVWDDCDKAARAMATDDNAGYIPPFDHETIWRGHATIVDELVEQCDKPDAIILSVGGGGLACGVLEGLYKNKWDDVPIFAVETQGAASLSASIKADKLTTLPYIDTIATSLGAKTVAEKLFNWSRKHAIIPITVTDDDAVVSCRQFLDDHHVLVEPACGAALAAIYRHSPNIENVENIVVIVCGGISFTLGQMLDYLMYTHIEA